MTAGTPVSGRWESVCFSFTPVAIHSRFRWAKETIWEKRSLLDAYVGGVVNKLCWPSIPSGACIRMTWKHSYRPTLGTEHSSEQSVTVQHREQLQ
ncbi:hypothetical protein BDK61_4571 [Haloarcula quadrata]|uniref:Uncharacterized protein n=1 Tax=Haloarcula quadrata TaxID=182779 RepID=A0A495QR45_9EURY|nr:hypothetical protein BDK61_4571 [Haloarcula quadrata]